MSATPVLTAFQISGPLTRVWASGGGRRLGCRRDSGLRRGLFRRDFVRFLCRPVRRVLRPDLQGWSGVIDESLRGDSQAFGELVHRYQDRLYSAVVHIVRCRAEAEDVVQEAFVQAYVKLQTFKHNSRFYTWLYRIAVNVSISHRRRRKIEVSVEQNREATGDEPLDAFTSPSEPLDQAERKQKLEHALTLLTEEHRSIIVLRHMEEFSYEESADILDISVGTVRSRLHRARAQLLVHLKKVMPDEAAEFED